MLCGCPPQGTRITLAELHRLEQQAAALEPVQIDTAKLSLTEIQRYQVQPGDVLSITLIGMTAQYDQNVFRLRVDRDGTINMPQVGRVKVAGLDLDSVEQAVYAAHVPKYVKDLSLFVELSDVESTTVVVMFPGGQSRLVTLPQNERNVLYALARTIIRVAAVGPAGLGPAGVGAGGAGAVGGAAGAGLLGGGAVASGRVRVQPIDPARPTLTYDLRDINDVRRALLAPPLQSGDMVVVEPLDTPAVYVMGLVNAPGPVAVAPDGTLSLVRAIASAGGLRDFLLPSEATLWRRLPNGEQARVRIELAQVMSGEIPDVTLKAGDVLDVPHTPETRFREWVLLNVRVGPFGVGAFYDPVTVLTFREDDRGDEVGFGRALRDTLRFGIPSVLLPTPAPPATTP